MTADQIAWLLIKLAAGLFIATYLIDHVSRRINRPNRDPDA